MLSRTELFSIANDPELALDAVGKDLFPEVIQALIGFARDCHCGRNPVFSIDIPEEVPPVVPVLLYYIDKLYPGSVPPAILSGRQVSSALNGCRKDNMRLMSEFSKISGVLDRKGIGCMPIKGGAIKAMLPSVPRLMADIDMLVQESDFKAALSEVRSLGYTYVLDVHSADVYGSERDKNVLDIHKYVMMNTGEERNITADLFRRASRACVFGVDAFLPSAEDLVFILLVTDARNIVDGKNPAGIVTSILDISYLVSGKTDFDWDIVFENARRSGSLSMLRFVGSLLDGIFPGLVPDFSSDEIEYAGFCKRLCYKRYCLVPLQIESHRLSVANLFKHPSTVLSFFKVRPKYTFLKLFRNNCKFIDLYLKSFS